MKTISCVKMFGLFAIVALALAVLSPTLEAATLDEATAKALENCVPSDPELRQASYQRLRNDRRHMIGTLLLLIRELEEKPLERHLAGSRLCFAIKVLGLLRAEEATMPLMDLIDLRFPRYGRATRAPEDPEVILALAQIGKPASKAAVEYLAKDKSTKRAVMYVRVITLVEGVEVGKFMVQQAATAESDPAKKARLSKAIALFADANKVVP